jgi:SAM-dependent methyltransferase
MRGPRVTIATVTWKLSRAGQRLAAAMRRDGVRGLSTEAAQLTGEFSRVPVALAAEYVFDLRRGIRTRGFVRNDQQLAGISVGGDPNYYQPIGLPLLRRLASTVPVDRPTTTFVDLGAGRGRAVILAAELGFGRVLGVELDGELAAEGADNVRRWQSSRRGRRLEEQQVDVIQGDAAATTLPEGPLVIALFNSFGPSTLRLMLGNLCADRKNPKDPVFFAYINPVHEDTLEEFPRLVPFSRGRGWAVYRLEPELASA